MAQNKLQKLRLPSMNSRLQREGKFDHPGCLYLLPIMESATKYPTLPHVSGNSHITHPTPRIAETYFPP